MKTAAPVFAVSVQSRANSQITSVMETFPVIMSKGGTRLAVCHRLTAISHFRIANKVHGSGRTTTQEHANFAQRSQSRSLDNQSALIGSHQQSIRHL